MNFDTTQPPEEQNNHASFRFQQFEVWHDRCAMKVGTDGVLLGAWVNGKGVERILDVGVGSGLISLMLAQRFSTTNVLGVDIDAAAVEQARENFLRSPFAERLEADVCDFRTLPHLPWAGKRLLIVSNPPFFTEDTLAPDAARATARSSCSLPFDLLIKNASALLDVQGRFAVIIPYVRVSDFVLTAAAHGLYLQRRCDVQTSPRKPVKRTLLEFEKHTGTTSFETLCLHNADGSLSEAYRELTADFYLNMK